MDEYIYKKKFALSHFNIMTFTEMKGMSDYEIDIYYKILTEYLDSNKKEA